MSRLVFAAIAALLAAQLAPAADPKVYKVGLPKSAFRDVPPALLTFAGEPFRDLMKSQTGLDGEIVIDADAMNVAKLLDSGKLHFGVFLGHEFAWAKEKYPALEPIVCSIPRPKEVQAFLLVRWDCKSTTLADFKGQKLVLAKTSRDHARLFLNRKKAGEMMEGSFCSIEKADTVHDAIHKVIEGDADVTVADGAAWSYFQKLYPGNSQNLRVLAKSEVFPPSVIVCKKGAISDAAIKKLHDGMLTAHDSSRSAKMMNLIKIEKFDELPSNYDDMLKACRKAYPTPLSDK